MKLPPHPLLLAVGWSVVLVCYTSLLAAGVHGPGAKGSHAVTLGLWFSFLLGAPIGMFYGTWVWWKRLASPAHRLAGQLGLAFPILLMLALAGGYVVLSS